MSKTCHLHVAPTCMTSIWLRKAAGCESQVGPSHLLLVHIQCGVLLGQKDIREEDRVV